MPENTQDQGQQVKKEGEAIKMLVQVYELETGEKIIGHDELEHLRKFHSDKRLGENQR